MDEGAQRQAVPPRRREVGDVDASVALGLFLAPGEQPAGTNLRLCEAEMRPSVSGQKLASRRDCCKMLCEFFRRRLSVPVVTQQIARAYSCFSGNNSESCCRRLDGDLKEVNVRPGPKQRQLGKKTDRGHSRRWQTGNQYCCIDLESVCRFSTLKSELDRIFLMIDCLVISSFHCRLLIISNIYHRYNFNQNE